MTTKDSLNKTKRLETQIPWKMFLSIQAFVIIIIAMTVLFTHLGAFPFGGQGIYRFLPGDILIDFIWLYIFSLIVGVIVYFATPALSVFFWKLHRVITGRNYDYYVQEIDIQSTSSIAFRRMILPAFVALGISYSISNIPRVVNAIIITDGFDTLASEAETIVTSISLLFILLLLSCFIVLLFAPMWLMQDRGLVSERKITSRTTSDIEGVGNWYLKLLKGFAGISTMVAYLFTIIQTVEWYQFVMESPPEGGLAVLIFIIPMIAVIVSPLLALGPISFVYVIYEKALRKNLSTIGSRINREGLSKFEIGLREDP
ncbi:MAG: hypothetical protein ACFFCP_00945 [Promethearchaeota archaeon]